MNLIRQFDINENDLITITGGGGKTSLMFALSEALQQAGIFHILTTTAKISIAGIDKERLLINPDLEIIRQGIVAADKNGLIIGKENLPDQKISGFTGEQLRKLQTSLQPLIILNEGDGSKGKPYKFYAEHEPVIPLATTKIIHVIGAETFNQPIADETFHRANLYTGDGLFFDEEILYASLKYFCETKLSNVGDGKRIFFVNKAEGDNQLPAQKMCAVAKPLFSNCFWGSLKDGWLEQF